MNTTNNKPPHLNKQLTNLNYPRLNMNLNWVKKKTFKVHLNSKKFKYSWFIHTQQQGLSPKLLGVSYDPQQDCKVDHMYSFHPF